MPRDKCVTFVMDDNVSGRASKQIEYPAFISKTLHETILLAYLVQHLKNDQKKIGKYWLNIKKKFKYFKILVKIFICTSACMMT